MFFLCLPDIVWVFWITSTSFPCFSLKKIKHASRWIGEDKRCLGANVCAYWLFIHVVFLPSVQCSQERIWNQVTMTMIVWLLKISELFQWSLFNFSDWNFRSQPFLNRKLFKFILLLSTLLVLIMLFCSVLCNVVFNCVDYSRLIYQISI